MTISFEEFEEMLANRSSAGVTLSLRFDALAKAT